MKKAGSFYNKQEPDVNKESDIQPDIGSYSVRKEGTLKYKEGKKMEKDGRYRLIMPIAGRSRIGVRKCFERNRRR